MVGFAGYGLYVPDETVSGEEIAQRSDVPEEVVVEKMGVREKRVCHPDEDHVTDMCGAAAEEALADAGIEATKLDTVRYHGSEYKDYVIWSVAANVAERLDADGAFASESYVLCAGAPVVLRQAKAMLIADRLERVLLVSASREEDLVDYANEDSSFMFNFGSGACAMVLEADPDDPLAIIRESTAVTDGSFSEDVVMPAGGLRNPPSHVTVDTGLHAFDVPDPEGIKERLADASLPNFLAVADIALERSGYGRDELDFVVLTPIKQSFHELLCLKLDARGYYLDEFGHVQNVDQALALDAGLRAGSTDPGDVVCFLAAGTGYTWAATVLEWHG